MHALSQEQLDGFAENVVLQVTEGDSASFIEALHKKASDTLFKKIEECFALSFALADKEVLISLVEQNTGLSPARKEEAGHYGGLLLLAEETAVGALEDRKKTIQKLIAAMKRPVFDLFLQLQEREKENEEKREEEELRPEEELSPEEEAVLYTTRLAFELVQEKSTLDLSPAEFDDWLAKGDAQLKFEMECTLEHLGVPRTGTLREGLHAGYKRRYYPQLERDFELAKETLRQAVREKPEEVYALIKPFKEGPALRFLFPEYIEALSDLGLEKPSLVDKLRQWMRGSKKAAALAPEVEGQSPGLQPTQD